MDPAFLLIGVRSILSDNENQLIALVKSAMRRFAVNVNPRYVLRMNPRNGCHLKVIFSQFCMEHCFRFGFSLLSSPLSWQNNNL